jgi:hypothetical protein
MKKKINFRSELDPILTDEDYEDDFEEDEEFEDEDEDAEEELDG